MRFFLNVVALLGSIACATAFIIYTTFYARGGPVYVTPVSYQIWFSGICFFYTLELQLFLNTSLQNFGVIHLFTNILAIIVSLALLVLLALSKSTTAIWAAFLILINATILFVYFYRKQKAPSIADYQPLSLQSDPNSPFEFNTCISVANLVLVFIAVVLLGLLLGGTALQAAGSLKYGPQGKFITLKTMDNRMQSVLVYCEGPTNSSFPVIVLDSGIFLFFSLKIVMNLAPRRFTWDCRLLASHEKFHGCSKTSFYFLLLVFPDSNRLKGVQDLHVRQARNWLL